MKVFILLQLLFSLSNAHNFLLVSPVFGYSHLKFMSKVGDTLANAGHNVTILQIYNYEHFGEIRMIKNKNIELIDYHDEKNAVSNENSASAFKFMWNTEIINNPITGALATSSVLFNEMKTMCEKVLLDKELHKWILSKNFDGIISETFDFCGLYLGDHLKLNIIPMHSSTISIPSFYAIGEPSLLNFLPSMRTKFGEDQTVSDRINDIIALPCLELAFSKLFEKQYNQAYSLLNGDVRHWKQILQTATFYFSNGNDYISFPTPFIPKHIRIGGFTIDPPKNLKLDDDYDKILSLRKSTVLISFGTVIQSADMPDSFKNGIIKMFHKLPEITFIWKYEVDDDQILKRLPKNVILKKWVPQPALLADPRLKLFITHGGLGSTLEVAYSGKPSLMIPVFGDQLLNAKMLSRHGGAKVFDKYDLENEEKLVSAIKEVIGNDKFNESSVLVSNLLRNQPIDPKTNLLKHVEFSARFGRVEALEPYNVQYNFIQYYMLDAYLFLLLILLLLFYFTHLIVKFVYRRVIRSKSKKE
uniref:glucuronosyltransferase n=1 Tax=Caenorhabditis tropicalis TaxID=1561998 RepID=A0A1I7T4K7_9PELO